MARYRSKALARAIVKSFIEATGVEPPGQDTIDHWVERYEALSWVSRSDREAWLQTLVEALVVGGPVIIAHPTKMTGWLCAACEGDGLSPDLLRCFLHHLEKNRTTGTGEKQASTPSINLVPAAKQRA